MAALGKAILAGLVALAVSSIPVYADGIAAALVARDTVLIKPTSVPNDRFTIPAEPLPAGDLVLAWFSMARDGDVNAQIASATSSSRTWVFVADLDAGAKRLSVYKSQEPAATNEAILVQLAGPVPNSTPYSYHLDRFTGASGIGNIATHFQNANQNSDAVTLPAQSVPGSIITVGLILPRKPLGSVITAGYADPTTFVILGCDTDTETPSVEIRLCTEASTDYETPAGYRWSGAGRRSDMLALEVLP